MWPGWLLLVFEKHEFDRASHWSVRWPGTPAHTSLRGQQIENTSRRSFSESQWPPIPLLAEQWFGGIAQQCFSETMLIGNFCFYRQWMTSLPLLLNWQVFLGNDKKLWNMETLHTPIDLMSCSSESLHYFYRPLAQGALTREKDQLCERCPSVCFWLLPLFNSGSGAVRSWQLRRSAMGLWITRRTGAHHRHLTVRIRTCWSSILEGAGTVAVGNGCPEEEACGSFANCQAGSARAAADEVNLGYPIRGWITSWRSQQMIPESTAREGLSQMKTITMTKKKGTRRRTLEEWAPVTRLWWRNFMRISDTSRRKSSSRVLRMGRARREVVKYVKEEFRCSIREAHPKPKGRKGDWCGRVVHAQWVTKEKCASPECGRLGHLLSDPGTFWGRNIVSAGVESLHEKLGQGVWSPWDSGGGSRTRVHGQLQP